MRDKNRVNRIVAGKIIEYCEQIESFIQRFGSTFEAFNSDRAFQLSVGMCIVQIGELTKRFSDDFRAQHSEIPWQAIKAMRNVLVYEYEAVDFETAWNVLSQRIPELKARLEKILAAEDGADDSQV